MLTLYADYLATFSLQNIDRRRCPSTVRTRQWLAGCAALAMMVAAPGCSSESNSGSQAKSTNAAANQTAAPASPNTPAPAASTDAPHAPASPAQPSAQVPPSPRTDGGSLIRVDSVDHDFGTVWVGDTLKHVFKISNVGDTLLEITTVKPSCGCTVAGTYPKQLKPGESGDFPFSLNSEKLNSGQFSKTVNIGSNDPAKPLVKLTLKGVCKKYIDVEPVAANFNAVDGDSEHEKVVKIRNNAKEPLQLEILPTQEKRISATLVETQPGEEFELHVKTVPPIEPGMINAVLNIRTNNESQKDLSVRAYARIPKRIDISPPTVLFSPQANAQREQIRPLRMNNYGTTPVNLLWARADDPKIELTTRELKAGYAYTVTVKMPAGYELPEEGRTITLKTDDAEKPELMIPVRSSEARAAQKRPAELMIGKAIPSFDHRTVEDKPVKSADLDQVTVLNFFAVNCPHCAKQLPKVEKLRADYEPKGVRFVNVSQTMSKKEYTVDQVKEKLDSLGVNSELVTNPENDFGRLFAATSFPTAVILGKSGKVEGVLVGNNATLESQIQEYLTKSLATK
jgi:thiol-disulfide isomerase/thioredoxin